MYYIHGKKASNYIFIFFAHRYDAMSESQFVFLQDSRFSM
jgi:hypothetical protein